MVNTTASCHLANATSVFRDHAQERARTAHHCHLGLDFGTARAAYPVHLPFTGAHAVNALRMTVLALLLNVPIRAHAQFPHSHRHRLVTPRRSRRVARPHRTERS